MLTMVFGVLAPTLAQAMVAASDKEHWIEICSASGMIWLQADASDAVDAESDRSMPTADMNSHCPWCSFHGSGAGFPTAELTVPLQPLSAHAVPFWAGVSPTDAAWNHAQARAPPTAS